MAERLVCAHPRCQTVIRSRRICCERHFWNLPDDYRKRCSVAARATVSDSERGAIYLEVRDYLASRMVGEHDKVTCRGRDCDQDIIWMKGFRKDGSTYHVPVDAATVSAEDSDYDRKKHVAHWATCPNADDLRRRRQS